MADFADFLAAEVVRNVYEGDTTPYSPTPSDLDFISTQHLLFRELTESFPTSLGIEVSRKELEAKHLTTNMALTYGEIGAR